MRKRRRQPTGNTSGEAVEHGNGTGPQKSSKTQKRKYDDEQDDEANSPTKGNPKRKRMHLKQNDQRTYGKTQTSARGRTNHLKDKGCPKERKKKLRNEKMKISRKRLEGNTAHELVLQAKESKRITRSSIKNADKIEKSINKDSDSKLRHQRKKSQCNVESFSRKDKKLRKNKPPQTSSTQIKSIPFRKSNRKKVKEQQHRSNIRQSTQTESCIESKGKGNKHNVQKRERKLLKKTQNIEAMPDKTSHRDFTNLFLKKITVELHPVSGYKGDIHEISVSHDGLLWVNYLDNTVHLRNTTGTVLKSFELDVRPVFSCCTPEGDLLVTQGYGTGYKPLITLLSRDGESKVLADLSSFATNLLGILYKDERIYVVANSDLDEEGRKYFIVKLDMNGEVECVYDTAETHDSVNQLILLNGQIVAFRISDVVMLPLEADAIASVAMNKVNIRNAYSGSGSVDNLGNVIIGSNALLLIIDPSLEFKRELDTGISGRIISTAVDQQNKLWFGTADGKLYSTKYLK